MWVTAWRGIVMVWWVVCAQHAGAAELNLYASLARSLGLGGHGAPILAAVAVWGVIGAVGLRFRSQCLAKAACGDLALDPGVTLHNMVREALGFVDRLAQDHCGPNWVGYLPFLFAVFSYTLVSNLSGLVPGLPPATENLSLNLGLGVASFVVYHWAGVREHGSAYLKQFTGPMLALAPLFMIIEGVSHVVRPLSLSFRLMANIFCDHLILSVFSGIVPLVVPAIFLGFGLLVACLQSFVFTLLTSIYISMAISHDH